VQRQYRTENSRRRVVLLNWQNFRLSDIALLSVVYTPRRITMSNSHVSMQSSDVSLCEDIAHHAVAFTGVKPTLWSACYNPASILNKPCPQGLGERTCPLCWRYPRPSNRSVQASPRGSCSNRPRMPHIVYRQLAIRKKPREARGASIQGGENQKGHRIASRPEVISSLTSKSKTHHDSNYSTSSEVFRTCHDAFWERGYGEIGGRGIRNDGQETVL
jgi:hypothetical protein